MTEWTPDRLRVALRLYLLADSALVPPERLLDAVAAALRGGVTAVQLRAKTATASELLELASAIKGLCRTSDVPFVVNDRADVALAGEADHSPPEARRLLGPDAIVGVSVDSAQEARIATAQGASYVSAGPMFASATSTTASPAAGESLLRSVRAATRLPLVVIGGITAERASALYAAGADGVCVGAAILRAADTEAAASAFAAASSQT